MNVKRVIIAILFYSLLIISLGCNKIGLPVKEEGILKKQGATIYMYGSHVLTDQDGNTLYALHSDKVDMDDYLNEYVKIKGRRYEHTVDGGPKLIEVKTIKK